MFLARRIFAFALFLMVALAVAGGGDQLTAQLRSQGTRCMRQPSWGAS